MSEVDLTTPAEPVKTVKPNKPYPDFPLFLHAAGSVSVRGRNNSDEVLALGWAQGQTVAQAEWPERDSWIYFPWQEIQRPGNRD
jgi:hypothetical protein